MTLDSCNGRRKGFRESRNRYRKSPNRYRQSRNRYRKSPNRYRQSPNRYENSCEAYGIAMEACKDVREGNRVGVQDCTAPLKGCSQERNDCGHR